MKTFLKITLIVVLVLLALKCLPLVIVGALVGVLLAGLLVVALGFAFALSPIWIPVLVVMGAVSLFKKLGNKPAAPPVIPA